MAGQSYDDRGMWNGTSRVMTEVYGAIMTEVGGGTSRKMKVCGATESILSNSVR